MEFKDYYKTLGVARDASGDEIKRAYRRLARKYHPDVSKEADAEARFKEVREAYEVLKDEEKRSAYDRFGKDWKAGREFRPPPGFDREFSFSGGDFGGQRNEGFSRFFETLFGEGSPFGGEFEDSAFRGRDVSVRISISLEDAYRGATRQLTIEPSSRGGRRRTLNVRIPKGVTAGQRIRLEDQGTAGGDLYLEVQFEPHDTFAVEGRDIHVVLPVTPYEAALGRTVKAPTLGGPVDLKIPIGSSSGKRLRLKGRGLPGSPPGDQYVELKIVLPRQVDAAARALYEKLEKTQPYDPRRTVTRSRARDAG